MDIQTVSRIKERKTKKTAMLRLMQQGEMKRNKHTLQENERNIKIKIQEVYGLLERGRETEVRARERTYRIRDS